MILPGVAPQFQVALATSYLEGQALLWRSQREESVRQDVLLACTNLDALLLVLKQHFIPLEGRLVARDKLARLSQRTSITAYNEAFLKLVLSIPGMAEDEKVDRYTRGLKAWTPSIGNDQIVSDLTGGHGHRRQGGCYYLGFPSNPELHSCSAYGGWGDSHGTRYGTTRVSGYLLHLWAVGTLGFELPYEPGLWATRWSCWPRSWRCKTR